MPLISEATGFLASSLVLVTFTMKDMRMLRMIAVLSNFAFIAYGLLAGLPPVLTLHLLLLPLNLLRLREISASSGERPVLTVSPHILRRSPYGSVTGGDSCLAEFLQERNHAALLS